MGAQLVLMLAILGWSLVVVKLGKWRAERCLRTLMDRSFFLVLEGVPRFTVLSRGLLEINTVSAKSRNHLYIRGLAYHSREPSHRRALDLSVKSKRRVLVKEQTMLAEKSVQRHEALFIVAPTC